MLWFCDYYNTCSLVGGPISTQITHGKEQKHNRTRGVKKTKIKLEDYQIDYFFYIKTKLDFDQSSRLFLFYLIDIMNLYIYVISYKVSFKFFYMILGDNILVSEEVLVRTI